LTGPGLDSAETGVFQSPSILLKLIDADVDGSTRERRADMWIVRNTLKGALYVEDLDIQIPAKEEFDLDVVGRETAERSNHLRVALAEGYLQTVKRSGPGSEYRAEVPEDDLRREIALLKQAILDELGHHDAAPESTPSPSTGGDTMRREKKLRRVINEREEEFRGDIYEDLYRFRDELMDELKGLIRKVSPENADDSYTDAELKARIAMLEEKEREIQASRGAAGRREEIINSRSDEISDLLGDQLS
jgi:hypothetical protein